MYSIYVSKKLPHVVALRYSPDNNNKDMLNA